MPHLSHADQTAMFGALRELYAELDVGPLRELMVRIASRIVPNEWSSYNEIAREGHRSLVNFRIPDSAEVQQHAPGLLACVHEHPVIKYSANHSLKAHMLSDFYSWRAFEGSKIFNEYYRHVGVRHQLYVTFDSGRGPHRAIALNRKNSDFSERDRSILNFLSPHFTQAYANAMRVQKLRPSPEPRESKSGGETLAPLPELTPRENEVLGWIARGKSNPEIATILGLSVRTVYKHVENLFAKMGIESRAQAMVRVLGDRR
jgi:DNA-binding CsgD family transcriptional regulator